MKFIVIFLLTSTVSISWAKSSFTCTPIEGFYPNNHSGITSITFESAAKTTNFTNFNFLKINYGGKSDDMMVRKIDSHKTTQMELIPTSRSNSTSKAFIMISKSPREINATKTFSGVIFLATKINDLNLKFEQIPKGTPLDIFNFSCTIR